MLDNNKLLGRNVFESLSHRFYQDDFKNMTLIKSNFLLDIYSAQFKIKYQGIDQVYLLKLKALSFTEDEVEKLITFMFKNRNHEKFSKISKSLLDYQGHIYKETTRSLSLVYERDENCNVLDLKQLFRDRRYNKEHIVKLEIIKKLIKICKGLEEIGIGLGLIHPDLIFYSSEKGFVYFDFIIHCILEIKKDIPAFIQDLNKAANKNNDMYQLLIIAIYFFSKNFKSDKGKSIKYEEIVQLNLKDFYNNDSHFRETKKSLQNYFKLSQEEEEVYTDIHPNYSEKVYNIFPTLFSDLIFNNLIHCSENKMLVKYFLTNFENFYFTVCLANLNCSRCILDSESGNKMEEQSFCYTETKLGETKKLKFNKACFEVLCEKCRPHHECNFIKLNKLSRHSPQSRLKEMLVQIENLKQNFFLFPKCKEIQLNIKEIEDFYLKFKRFLYNKKASLIMRENKLFGLFKSLGISLSSQFIELEENTHLKNLQISRLNDKKEEWKAACSEFQPKYTNLKILEKRFKEMEGTYLQSYKFANPKIIFQLLVSQGLKDLELSISHIIENSIQRVEKDVKVFIKNEQALPILDNHEIDLRSLELNAKENLPYLAAVDLRTNFISLIKISSVSKPDLIDIGQELYDSRWVNMKTGIFICGGSNEVLGKSAFFMPYEYKKTKKEEKLIDNKKYLVERRKTFKVEKMNQSRAKHQMAYCEYKIFCIGGYQNQSCEFFDFIRQKWEKIPDLNQPRHGAGLAIVNSSIIYLIGGYTVFVDQTSLEVCNKIEKFDIHNDLSWTLLNFSFDIPKTDIKNFIYEDSFHLSNFGTICLKKMNNKVLIVGGANKDKIASKMCFKFDWKSQKIVLEKQIFDKSYKFVENEFVNYGGDEYYLFSDEMSFTKLTIN